MSKESKEALTVLIVTHVTHAKGSKEALTVLIVTHVTHAKGSKEALTVLIVSHVTHVERVESSVYGFYTTLYTELCYSFYSCQKGRKCTLYKVGLAPPKHAVRAHNIFAHNFPNIQAIFNPKNVLES